MCVPKLVKNGFYSSFAFLRQVRAFSERLVSVMFGMEGHGSWR